MMKLVEGMLVRYKSKDVQNKTPFFTTPDQQDALRALLDTLLLRLPTFVFGVQALVLVSSEGAANPEDAALSLYCWCNPTQGVVISRTSNGQYSVSLVDATDYRVNAFGRYKVCQSQFDADSREHCFPTEKLLSGSWNSGL